MELRKKINNFIAKETKEQNRSKKVIVLMRIMCLMVITALILDMILCPSTHCFMGWLYYVTAIVVVLMIFSGSYFFTTTATLWTFGVGMLAWIATSVHYFGWEVGTQSYLPVLLILCFFSVYEKRVATWLLVLLFSAIHIILYNVFRFENPILTLNEFELLASQVVHTSTAFGCIALIANSFSRDTQKMEGKLIDYNNRLQKQANTDELTGLYNRRRAMEYLENEAANAQNDLGFSLCICDIDFFKKVNDTYGHNIGDAVLKAVAGVFQSSVRESDLVARWGGEEFLILFPGCNGDNAFLKLEEIQRRIRMMEVRDGDVCVKITMTFGLSEFNFSAGLTATLQEADEKLYKGKTAGRDRIVY